MNRLAQESSPYLKQHQENPVDWHPWGDEALARAKREDKPILLSVGYSACHWCHVMAHECFENPDIAALMNEHFINIKVDREERPDLDQIYQNVAQAMTRSGGWPLTVFLTPDLKPFFGGTYFPPEDRYGRPGFPRLLLALSNAYKNEHEAIVENATKLTQVIQTLESAGRAEKPSLPTSDAIEDAASTLVDLCDWEHGGFGGAPKFPNAMMLDFVWRVGRSTDDERAQRAVLLTLEQMATGGIYDQLGGGFHRYSVDEAWAVPHFEKMLYDNGLLLKTYAQVLLAPDAQVERRELFVEVLEQTIDYVLREMRTSDGAFFAAQDADSEGEEGKFFVWDRKDLSEILSGDELEFFCLRYGVSEGGNFEHGKTVLFLDRSIEEIAKEKDKSTQEIQESLDASSAKVLAARSKRIPPGTDDKVLTSWNSLMISGLAWAAQALEKEGRTEAAKKASDAARKAFDFLSSRLTRDGNRLSSTFQAGQPRFNGYLDDYAFLAMAALDLARFETQDSARLTRELTQAKNWIETVLKHFEDPAGGGYFFTSDDHEALIQRPKTVYDQAIPSGTGVVLQCLAALAEIDLDGQGARYSAELERQIASLFPGTLRNPFGYGELLNASKLWLDGAVVVSGQGAGQEIVSPEVFQKAADKSQGTDFLVCYRKTCSLPLKSAGELKSALSLISETRKTS